MAVVAKGDWVVVRNVTELTSNNSKCAPAYTGTIFKFGTDVADMAEGDIIYFSLSGALSSYHDGLDQDFYFIQKYDVILTNN